MKERGKAVEMYNNDLYGQDYSFCSDLPCQKHPSSSSVGICPHCLKDRLLKLVCSDCGEQRLSSCSCTSQISSSNRNSCSTDVGSVGRISFLIDTDQRNSDHQPSSSAAASLLPNSNKKQGKTGEVVADFLLKRSNSSCVEIKRKRGFWRIKRLFSKKKEKGFDRNSVGGGIEEGNNDLWVVDYMGVSRCRSLCSFRGNNGFFGSEDGTFSGARSSMSAARSSISAARSSNAVFDPDRKSGFSEAEPRKSGFSLKDGNFTSLDDSGFIDLKFDFPSDPKGADFSDLRSGFGSMRGGGDDHFGSGGGAGDGVLGGGHGGSCRMTVSDRGIKRSRKSFKSWRWIFRQHHPISGKKKDEDFVAVKNLAQINL